MKLSRKLESEKQRVKLQMIKDRIMQQLDYSESPGRKRSVQFKIGHSGDINSKTLGAISFDEFVQKKNLILAFVGAIRHVIRFNSVLLLKVLNEHVVVGTEHSATLYPVYEVV